MNASTLSNMLGRFRISRRISIPGAGSGPQLLIRLPLIGALCFLVGFAALAPFNAVPNSETITTFAADCGTPKTIFNLGDTVCAEVRGSLLGPPVQRRFEWVAPNGFIFQLGPDVTTDPQSNSIVIPTTGPFARVGTWTVKTVDSSNDGYGSTTFVVLDQNNAAVDLWASISAPFQVSAGSSAPFSVFLTNKGPNDAEDVELTVSVATNSTFQSETQVTGPGFTCTTASGVSTCTIASLPAHTSAQFVFVFQIDPATPGGTGISSSVSVSSSTAELFSADNTATAFVTLPPQSQATCDVTCPTDITTPKTQGQCGAVVNFTATGAGATCGTIICSPASNSFFPLGTTNVTCIGESGGPCTFTVTVEDPQAPTITCPANVTATESSPGFGLAVVHYPPPTLNDNCVAPIVACEPPSGSTFEVGTTTVTCQTSVGSVTVNCSFTVTVTGNGGGGCTITCPADVSQSASAGQCSAAVNYPAPTTGESCGTVTCTPSSGSTFPVGVTLVTCSGTGDSCTFSVTVLAAEAPTITTCPTNKTISANADCEAVIPNLLGEVVATGCNVTISQSPEAGTIVGAGVVTVIITAENITGEATCTSTTVTIQDLTPPTISCQGNITASNDADQCGAIITYNAPEASDTCSTVATTCSPASGAVFPVGSTTVTCTAADETGNQASCSFTVTINDTQSPTISCPANISVGTDPNQPAATVPFQATVNDNCPGATTVCSPSSGSQFGLGTTTVNCTVTDAANNTASCSFTVTVTDTQPPTITCPANITANNAAGQCSAPVTYPNPTVTDNQPDPTSSCSPPSNSTFPVGVTIVSCTATDVGGNQSNCSFTVTVRDVQAPTIDCPANITVANTTGQCSAIVNVGVPTATDNCSVASVSAVRSDGLALSAPYPVGTTTITWTARDVAGNQVSCAQSILVNDTQAPVITNASANPSSLWPPNNKMVEVTINYTVADNCTSTGAINCDLAVSSNEPPGSGNPHTSPDWTVIDAHRVKLKADRDGEGSGRVYTITITCKDSKNNTSTQTVTVTVPHNQ